MNEDLVAVLKRLGKSLSIILNLLSSCVIVVGLGFVTILCVYSIPYLKFGYLTNAVIDLNAWVYDKTLAWAWITIFVAFGINIIKMIIVWIVKAVRSKKPFNAKDFVEWLTKN
jgi:hypothetical protein